jgi:acyl-CoA dehydrogenase
MPAESIYLTPEHAALREQVARFIAKEVEPVAEAWEAQGHVPREVLRKMGALGFLGITAPVEYGGAGADPLTNVVFAEALSQSTFGGFIVTVLVHTDMAGPHLMRAGSKAQLDRYLRKVLSGELITAIAVTEPDAGSDVAAIRTRARRDGDSWVLNGTKMVITHGVHGDLFFVAARSDPEAASSNRRSRGISMFIVEKNTPGFRVGRALKKQGWLSSDTAELVFEDCRIPGENLLGEESGGFYAIMQNFQNERVVLGAMAVGHATQAIRLALEHTMNRKAFGATLFDQQTIRQRLAMLEAKNEAARQLLYHCGWLMSQRRDCVREVSMLKAFAGELANEATYTCQQFHGGMGYMRETAIERLVRDARILSIGGGATEVMLEEVAKRFTP